MKLLKLILVSLAAIVISSCTESSKYSYESVKGDPMDARIYTLPNGLKVYMTVNPESPRIQTAIAVRVGGKNDPAQTTGLAHYFEHLMFKGTQQFGTQNYEAEKPLLDAIEAQFEIYRNTTDEAQRKAIYHVIDSLSYEASKLSIPNEYDKLMAAIGADGSNAFTGQDMTVYIEDIPSNQVENWAKIQADRFKNNVIRGFHTELETVYEEKNMSLTKDSRKVYEKLYAALFPNHPYGTQTVLGTQEHLKNPSITNIKNYYKQYYVPNNMAVIVSGDFNPDSMINVVDRYFGDMQPNAALPKLEFKPEAPLTQPVEVEVLGLEAPSVTLGWRFDGPVSGNTETMNLLSSVLFNGKAGLIDLNVNQQQKVLSSYAYFDEMADYSMLVIQATPKAGQTLEEVKDIVIAEIEKLKKGDFDETLLKASVNNYKLGQIRMYEDNWGRASVMYSSFINNTPWADVVASLDKTDKITKADIVAFANNNMNGGYAAIYKREGKDPNELKIAKPHITPIFTNRDTASLFLREVQATNVEPIEPIFADFNKDMKILKAKSDIPVLYKQNTSNGLFELTYEFEMGRNDDKYIPVSVSYTDFMGTGNRTPEQIKQELYNLACSYYVSVGYNRMSITLMGLDENMEAAIAILEDILTNAKGDEKTLENFKQDMLKDRANAKQNQAANFSMLQYYSMYGPKSPSTNIVSAEELKNLNVKDVDTNFKKLNNLEHNILYYGPRNDKDIVTLINEKHNVPEKLTPIVKNKEFKERVIAENEVLIAPYDAKQIYFIALSNRGESFDPAIYPILTMYNEYFGGGMSSIVFQEMREARGLAYSAWSRLSEPMSADKPYFYKAFIATQNDKAGDAMDAFAEIINNMPESETAFKITKDNLLTNLRTQRLTKTDVLWSYLNARDLGLDYNRDKELFEKVQNMTLADVKAFQQQWIKDRKYSYCILGDKNDLDLKRLEKYGKIKFVTTEDIFGY